MDGLEVPRSSFKKRLWLSARRKKKGPRPRRNRVGKENICPDNNRLVTSEANPRDTARKNGAIISDLDILDHIGPYADVVPEERKHNKLFTATTNDWTGLGGPVLTVALIHNVPWTRGRSNVSETCDSINVVEKMEEENCVASQEQDTFANVTNTNLNFSGNSTPTSTSSCSLQIEIDESSNDKISAISGRRLFNVQYLFEQMAAINHNPFQCTFKDLRFITEQRSGSYSKFVFLCNMCGTKEIIKNETKASNLNKQVVQAVVCSGSGYAQLEEFSAHLNMPCMSEKTFIKENMLLGDILHDVGLESMYNAGLEEKELAIRKGHVDVDGVPFIPIVADASWGKRSYRGSKYNSLSGVACIVGLETRKVLFLGIRNSYCSVCAVAKNRNVQPKEHKCFKNWSGTSTAMEADGVVEGFKCSIDMHGLKYTTLIGDGDSSVTSALNKALPYGHTTIIKKIECSNHLLRNYCSKLKNLTKKTENRFGLVPVTLRKCLEKNILRLRKAIKGAVDYNSKNTEKALRVNILKEDIQNGPCHVFGDHSSCKAYFCKGPQPGEENVVTQMKECGLWYDIYTSINSITNNIESLLIGKTNNIVEHFNAIIAKFIGGKRVNYSLRGSYESRCYAAAIKHNNQSLIEALHKASTSIDETREFSNKYVERHKKILKRKSATDSGRKFKRAKVTTGADEHYGDIEAEADLETDLFEKNKEQFLRNIQISPEKIKKIEQETIGQASNPEWVKQRKLRLTASMFGQVCKMKATTSCKNTIKTILYSTFKGSDATRYGNRNEPIAAKEIGSLLRVDIIPCGLFIDNDCPYLGASPDGLIGHDSILEIKCPSVAESMTPEEAIMQRKINYCTLDEKDSHKIKLKRNHNYYYQVQGQLNVTRRKYCFFVVWTPKGIVYEKVEKDQQFWDSNIDKLKQFYLQCILPEIIDPRLPRKLPIRDRIM